MSYRLATLQKRACARFDARLTQFSKPITRRISHGVECRRTVSTAIHRRFWSNATIRGLVSCATDATPITTTRLPTLPPYTPRVQTREENHRCNTDKTREREREFASYLSSLFRFFLSSFLPSSSVNERSSRSCSPSGSRLLLRHRRARMRAKDSSLALILDQIPPIGGVRSERK